MNDGFDSWGREKLLFTRKEIFPFPKPQPFSRKAGYLLWNIMKTQSVDKKTNLINAFFDTLLAYYGPQKWWPCQSRARWEIITGAILTQNTAWINVEKAIGICFPPG